MTTTVRRLTTTHRVALSVVLAALAVALAPFSIPVGIARLFPGQHMVNVLAAVLVGPWWGLGVAFTASLVRNVLGLGTPLAFPGSMVGVLLAGLAFRATRNVLFAAVGEVIGTGLIGAVVGALLVAPYIMDSTMAVGALIVPFLLSSIAGAALGVLGVQILRRAGYGE